MNAKLEDNTKQPQMADASLYNGQPIDTGLVCQGAGLTSCTSSISEIRDGVSVSNIPIGNKQWFVLRVSYGRVIKAKNVIEGKNIECYVPLRYKQIIKREKKQIIKVPLLPSFIFVHTTRRLVELLCNDIKVSDNSALFSFYYDHTSFREDAPNKNPPLTISDSAMNNFISLTSKRNPHIIPITSDNIKYKMGDEVMITEGEFKGIQGRVARIAGQQRVLVELFEGCLVATAYIPKDAMKKIESSCIN